MQKPYSLASQTIYQELLLTKLDHAVPDLRGRAVLRKRNGRGYWYDQYRVGTDVRERYIAEDTEATRHRIEQASELKSDLVAREQRCAEMVATLRASMYPTLDQQTGSLLSALASAGTFRLAGTLVGTHAFRLYGAEIGRPLGPAMAHVTDDLDIASFERLSLSLGDRVEPDMNSVLADLKFDPLPQLDHARPAWRWRQSRGTAVVEFLAPSFSDEEGMIDLPALGVSAQSFHFLNYLIADPIPAVGLYRHGILLQIPKPERYAVHKMIVATRRPERLRLKARKDILQAEALVEVLAEDRPYEIEAAFRDAWSRGNAWREQLEQALTRSDFLLGKLGGFRDG